LTPRYNKFSGQSHPFANTWPFVRVLVEAFTLDRCVWGSDGRPQQRRAQRRPCGQSDGVHEFGFGRAPQYDQTPDGHHHRAPDALQHACGDKGRGRARETAQQRSRRERRDRRGEHRAAPNRSAAQPPGRMNTATVSRYAVMPTCIETAEVPKPAGMAGKAVTMIVPSRNSMKNALATNSTNGFINGRPLLTICCPTESGSREAVEVVLGAKRVVRLIYPVCTFRAVRGDWREQTATRTDARVAVAGKDDDPEEIGFCSTQDRRGATRRRFRVGA